MANSLIPMRTPEFNGIFPAMITPFSKDERFDVESTKKIVDYLIGNGVQGIQCCGSTGEAASLSREERSQVIDLIVRHVNKRVPVIAGTGTTGTRETIELTKDAEKAGADAALVITPFYEIPTDDGIIRHYEAIADATDIPLIAYNVPQATMVNLTPNLVAKLVECVDKVVAIKESSGKTWQIGELIRLVGDQIAVLTGDDGGLFADFMLGCPGAIVAIGNIAPKLVVEIYSFIKKDEIEKARQVHYQLLPVATALDGEANWAAKVKEMVRLQGYPAGYSRQPYSSLLPDETKIMKQALRSAGLL